MQPVQDLSAVRPQEPQTFSDNKCAFPKAGPIGGIVVFVRLRHRAQGRQEETAERDTWTTRLRTTLREAHGPTLATLFKSGRLVLGIGLATAGTCFSGYSAILTFRDEI